MDIHSDNPTNSQTPVNYKAFTEDLFSEYLNSTVQINNKIGKVIDTFNDLLFVDFYTGGNGWYKREQLKLNTNHKTCAHVYLKKLVLLISNIVTETTMVIIKEAFGPWDLE